ncbi:MAG: hypothetical protein A2233_02920 [Candidatus Kerfeldbacteria bacterium RIFOXYA2_FULL_38_24]|uniref:Dephospho-CoA kinase n=1 Tax=Candidatus Kerfeldbacteria bacterium RIFOXYB2_FULL_38_14 TaxID=1798547 RepID=A0A1G2BAW0_9BACT|nr:MAG: hypothetical protein A2319_00665 [Candidatus Kerfeldbacteria bacterium RIFOXYB2_FULL_38_14]OGY86487.1 MAG: hypothetical protein A2233_02920 [Candidatus Kerfeldbacteria bacterium RIFOXYA2_FULL_38_24]OGY90475.1 MAG: hypothetical protein A2458_00970 [Candidatus Kerfeldbacteria bacterium RIFOXYC2_FULL_38_9]
MIIGLIGLKLSGKGTVASYLKEHYQAKSYSMSGVLSDILDRLYLPQSRQNMIELVTSLRAVFGEDILAQVRKQDIQKAQDKLAIIDAVRMPKEVAIFSTLPNFILLYVDAPLKMRFERAKNRGEKAGEKNMSFSDFQKEEKAITEQNIVALKTKADFIINNLGTLAQLYAQIEDFLKKTNFLQTK